MGRDTKSEEVSDQEAEKRRDEALRRALNTPPKRRTKLDEREPRENAKHRVVKNKP